MGMGMGRGNVYHTTQTRSRRKPHSGLERTSRLGQGPRSQGPESRVQGQGSIEVDKVDKPFLLFDQPMKTARKGFVHQCLHGRAGQGRVWGDDVDWVFRIMGWVCNCYGTVSVWV